MTNTRLLSILCAMRDAVLNDERITTIESKPLSDALQGIMDAIDALMGEATQKAQHTPGPWHKSRDMSVDMLITMPGGEVIAKISKEYVDHAIRNANARLIAAAPELLEALEWAVQFAPNGAAKDRVLRLIGKASNR